MKCEICGIELKRLGRHIVKTHHISLQDYYDKYLKKDGEDICTECGNKKDFGRDLNEAYSEFCSPSCAVSSDKIQKKMRDTCKENTGFENPFHNRDLMESSMLKKYGDESPIRVKSINDQRIKTLMERYNVDHPSKIESVKQQKIDTQILHFGDLYCRTPAARQIYRENFIKNIESQKGDYKVQRGRNEEEILNDISRINNVIIEQSYRVIGYVVDGYISSLNVVLEIDERHHRDTYYKEYDIRRQNEIQDHLKCTFIRISESDWLKDKTSEYEKITNQISQIQGTLNENIR